MEKKLKCILLIDDDEATNYINKMVIKRSGCAESVEVAESGREALEFLTSGTNGNHPQPELIFLDINMPAMNGWEFLDHYRNLEEIHKGEIIVVMLTTSLNPDDKAKAEKIEEISGFRNKPLDEEQLLIILQDYFPDRF